MLILNFESCGAADTMFPQLWLLFSSKWNANSSNCIWNIQSWRWRAAHHCHSIGCQQLLRSHGGEVGNVGHSVDQGHQWNGNVDGARQVPIDKKNTHVSQEWQIRQQCVYLTVYWILWNTIEMCNAICYILAWLHNLLCDIVEEIPATVGKWGLEEGQSYLSHWRVLTEFKRYVGS